MASITTPRTTFEFTIDTGLGTQNALLGGGRYDGLSEMLGGPRAPGIGFAIGEDRLILTLQAQAEAAPEVTPPWAGKKLDAYIAPLASRRTRLHSRWPARCAFPDLPSRSAMAARARPRLRSADGSQRHIILLGEDEVASSAYTVKTFATGGQIKVSAAELAAKLLT